MLVLSIVGMKCTIFGNLFTTTKIVLYPCVKDNFVIKSALMWVYAFSEIEFSINFAAGGYV